MFGCLGDLFIWVGFGMADWYVLRPHCDLLDVEGSDSTRGLSPKWWLVSTFTFCQAQAVTYSKGGGIIQGFALSEYDFLHKPCPFDMGRNKTLAGMGRLVCF